MKKFIKIPFPPNFIKVKIKSFPIWTKFCTFLDKTFNVGSGVLQVDFCVKIAKKAMKYLFKIFYHTRNQIKVLLIN